MKIWLACQVQTFTYQDENGEFTNEPRQNGRAAMVWSINDSSCVKSQLDMIGGLEYAHLCKSKKHAEQLVKFWNDCFRANGELK